MSLYRQYRPHSFADVVGQEHVVTTLENAARLDKLAHAFLFAGSRGTGKTSVARILAKVLMIQGIEDEVLQKQIVQGVENGSIVDLLEIDAASNRGIDDVRDLIEKIQFSPVVAAAKVYIIDEVHMLTKEAFNALLKTLEEPPPYAYFILATTELHKIPTTIQSRCQVFPFRRIREEDIIRRLQFIADTERITIDREALRAIAHHVEGGLRDAISLLDQMRSLDSIELKDVEQRIGGTGIEYVEAILEAIEGKDTDAVLKTVQTIEQQGVPLDVFLRQLLTITRKTLHKAIEEKQSTAPVMRTLDVLLEAIANLRISPVPGLVLESALLSLCQDTEAARSGSFQFAREQQPEKEEKVKEEKVSKKEKRKEKEAKSDASRPSDASNNEVADSSSSEKVEARRAEPSSDEDTSSKKSTDEPESEIQAAAIEAPELNLESLKEHWQSVIKETTPAAVRMSLKNGHIVSIEDTTVTVGFASDFHCQTVSKDEGRQAIEKVLEKIFRRHLKIHCTLSEESSEPIIDDDAEVNLAEAAAEVF